MRVRWTPAAAADLESIGDYLQERHPRYRSETLRKLYETIRGLKNSPYRGRPGQDDTREVVFTPLPYIAVYRVKGDAIEVLRIYHGAQKRS